ncbi:MAG TPA: ribonuclease H-like domain-containing protein [Candidatus Limnocylindrales bacterium]|nr:ribonuclease H-like domain-containing protein [Candidatus Limnocylindrales bacterium]
MEPTAASTLAARLTRLRALDTRLRPASELPRPAARAPAGPLVAAARRTRLAEALGGKLLDTPAGSIVVVERDVPLPFDPLPLRALPFPIDADRPLIMLDTETTGLGSGAGTLAFLVGLASWSGDRLHVRQLWLADQPEEPALLDALAASLPPDGWLVTYNGRAFDWPLLITRYRLQRRSPPPLAGHLDLLPVARQLWRHRLPDARLASVEAGVAGVRRGTDLPGALVPERFLRFLRDGDPRPLVPVGEHNRQDVISLGLLLVVLAEVLARPEGRSRAAAGDLVGLGRAFERAGQAAEALACHEAALERAAPLDRRDGRAVARPGGRLPTLDPALERARLLRRMGRRSEALEAWRAIAAEGGRRAIGAWIAVAKELEHGAHDPAAALEAVRQAEQLLARRRALGLFFREAERDLPYRRARLLRRLASAPASAPPAAPASASVASG